MGTKRGILVMNKNTEIITHQKHPPATTQREVALKNYFQCHSNLMMMMMN